MTADQQSALTALRAAEPIAARLGGAREPEDRAADILELWQGTETALRALMGGSSLGGQGLIRELRQREMISLGQAYALLEFLGARDRANRTTYRATDNDIVVAREGYRQLEAGLAASASEPAAPIAAPAPAYTPSPQSPPLEYSRPSSTGSDYSRPQVPPPPPAYAQAPTAPPTPAGAVQSNDGGYYTTRTGTIPANLWFIIALLVVVLAAVAGYATLYNRSDPDKDMTEAVAALQSGRREAARGAFTQIARENPELATPHVFLSRMSREEGDLGTARRELETAIRLEPANAIALREMGLILFSAGNYELSRRFFVRALNANPDDKASMGYLGCALARLNRFDEAQRFITRAGSGAWSSCLPSPTM